MRKRILLSVTIIFAFIPLLTLLTPQVIHAQNSGIAVTDNGFAPMVNPSAIAAGNAAGIAFYQEFEEKKGLLDTYSLYFNTNHLSYGFDSLTGDFNHKITLALKANEGVYYGGSLKWRDGGLSDLDFGFSALVRPLPLLSFGAKTPDVTGSFSDITLGAGIRPLASSPYWMSRLTFYLDSQASDILSPLSTGLSLEMLDGVILKGDFNHKDEVFNAGITFSTQFLSSSVNSEVSGSNSWRKGNYSLFASGKRMRSSFPIPFKLMVEYDRAGVINDFPRDWLSVRKVISNRSNGEISLLEFLSDMEKIRQDPDIDAVLFRDQQFITSFANIMEISRVLREVKSSGKKIYFYFESVSSVQYALAASVADGIFLTPQGILYLKGFSRTGLYFKDFFEKFGVRFHNFRSHEYKTAFNKYSEPGMTDEEKEALKSLYTSLQDELEKMILAGRGKKLKTSTPVGSNESVIEKIIGDGPYLSSSKALSAGLVDRLFYNDQLDNWIKTNKYTSHRYSNFPEKAMTNWEYFIKPSVAVIYVTGNIVTGSGIRGTNAGSDSVASAIKSARENPLVQGIILRINSGGGSALASDLIAREVALCSEGDDAKPVIVSMGGAAASGGYYIASPAEKIFAESVSITGSIGVIALFPDISGLLDKLDIKSETVKKSESGDFANITRPMSDEEVNKIRAFISESYSQFVNIVADGRSLDKEKVDESARGRVWTGIQAKDKSLVDKIGGITDAVSYLEETSFNGKEARLIEIVPGRSIFSFSDFIGISKIKKEDEPEAIKALFDFLKKTDYYKQDEPLYLMPYTMEELGLE
ncbi:MAG: signal peptide peptidase SppA [Spirochaetia bacterium]|jgi:protease-4|nr:signal peptide peptidase SppA [Spirochaetia bacterium]